MLRDWPSSDNLYRRKSRVYLDYFMQLSTSSLTQSLRPAFFPRMMVSRLSQLPSELKLVLGAMLLATLLFNTTASAPSGVSTAFFSEKIIHSHNTNDLVREELALVLGKIGELYRSIELVGETVHHKMAASEKSRT